MKTHQIESGDTLSALAEKYNTDIATLKKLNAEQIKNIDVIFDGQQLIVPDVPDLAPGKRAEKLTFDNQYLNQTQCTVPEYVDALYVPENPNTNKPQLLLLTKQAKENVIKDNERCKQALQGDKKQVLKNLIELGIMDQFNSIVHEAILKKIDSADKTLKDKGTPRAELYITAITERKALIDCISRQIETFPADNWDIALVNVQARAQAIESRFKERIALIEEQSNGESYFKSTDGGVIATRDLVAGAKQQRSKEIQKLQKSLVDDLNEKIEGLESEAINYAKTLRIKENGHTFQYSTKHKYYTSNFELNIDGALSKLRTERKSNGLCDYLDAKEIKANTKVPSLAIAFELYTYWKETGDKVLEKLKSEQLRFSVYFYSSNKNNDNFLESNYRGLFSAIYELNQSGIYLKEQCLTEQELFAGWKQVESIRESINNNTSIENLETQLESLDIPSIGYYSAYTCNLLIIQEVGLRIKDFAKLFGENEHYGERVKNLITYAEQSQDRCEVLEKTAQNKVHSPIWDYQKSELKWRYQAAGPDEVRNSHHLLWNETVWQPKNYNNQIFADSGANTRTVVECSLSSDPHTILYILSDNPVLSEDVAKNKQCSQPLKLEFKAGGPAAKDHLSKAIKNALDNKVEYTLAKWEFKQQATLTNLPDLIFPWQSEEYKETFFGLNAMVESSGGAQFTRFVCGTSATIDNDILANGVSAIKADAGASLTLASAHKNLKLRIPAKGEFQLDIPYITKEDNVRKVHNIGSAVIKFDGKVYGIAAASLCLGTEFKIGNISGDSTDGPEMVSGVGIKGEANLVSDSSSFGGPVLGRGGNQKSSIDAGVKMEVDAFAGIEAGGTIGCEFLWKEKPTSKLNSLFKLAQGFKMTAGWGYSGLFQCTFQDGRFVFISEMSATPLIGFGGKLATELNPKAADNFFAALLSLTHKKDFKRFAFFDESNNTFEYFNKIMTVAASFGLTIGQVLMLPFEIINDMEQQATEKENAFFVANFLIDDKHIANNKEWITDMTAETLAKLLSVLVHYNDIPPATFLSDKAYDRSEAAKRNQNQRKAILNILKWLGGKHPSNQQIHKFENAVQRMGLKNSEQLDKSKQWQRYAKNVIRLRDFYTQAFSQSYEFNNNNNNNNNNNKLSYMDTLRNDYTNFSNYLFLLTQQNIILEKPPEHRGRSRLPTMYTALPKENIEQLEALKKNGYQPSNWLIKN